MTNNSEEVKQNTNVCSIPKQIYLLFKLYKKTTYTLCIGHLSQEVSFIPSENEENMMHLPYHVAEKLGLNQTLCLNIWRSGQKVFLGPVIGVFVSPKHIKNIRTKKIPVSVQQHFRANNIAHCFLYYFSIRDINWSEQRIKGYLYDPLSHKWKNNWYPLPNVIYDRCIGLKKQELALAEQIRNQFTTMEDISFINKGSLGKWELSTCLSNYPELKLHLPKTIKYAHHDDIFQMLDEHGFIFLKSSDGYGAREVLSIKKGKKHYLITFNKRGLIKIKLRSKGKIKKLLNTFIKPKTYIVQQGIEALKQKKLHMDLRLLIQKDIQGSWKVTYNRARITDATNSIINSTLAKKIINYKDLKHTIAPFVHVDLLPSEQTINDLSLKISTCIEQEFGAYGELGLDLIIDQKGKIWFIEANSKPTKKVNVHLDSDTGISDQFLSVLAYAKYLQKVKQSFKVNITSK